MPLLSVTAVIVPATSTGLLIVIVTPGVIAPCWSAVRIRMLPVCTCASAGAASARTIAARNLKVRFMHSSKKLLGLSWRRRADPSAARTLSNARDRHPDVLHVFRTFDRSFEKLDLYCPL